MHAVEMFGTWRALVSASSCVFVILFLYGNASGSSVTKQYQIAMETDEVRLVLCGSQKIIFSSYATPNIESIAGTISESDSISWYVLEIDTGKIQKLELDESLTPVGCSADGMYFTASPNIYKGWKRDEVILSLSNGTTVGSKISGTVVWSPFSSDVLLLGTSIEPDDLASDIDSYRILFGSAQDRISTSPSWFNFAFGRPTLLFLTASETYNSFLGWHQLWQGTWVNAESPIGMRRLDLVVSGLTQEPVVVERLSSRQIVISTLPSSFNFLIYSADAPDVVLFCEITVSQTAECDHLELPSGFGISTHGARLALFDDGPVLMGVVQKSAEEFCIASWRADGDSYLCKITRLMTRSKNGVKYKFATWLLTPDRSHLLLLYYSDSLQVGQRLLVEIRNLELEQRD